MSQSSLPDPLSVAVAASDQIANALVDQPQLGEFSQKSFLNNVNSHRLLLRGFVVRAISQAD